MNDGLTLSLRQFGEAWRVLCQPSPEYAQAETEGVDYVFSGLPIAFFNVAILNGRDITSGTLQQHCSDACRWAADRNVPWMLVLTHETLAAGVEATAVLDSGGLAPVMPLTGMVAHALAPAARVARGIQLAVPREEAHLAALLEVNGLAYGMDLAAGQPLIATPAFWHGHVPVLGLVNGVPAACAAVFMVDGLRYVALVATDPAHQKRGYGEAAMRHALETAAQTYGEVPSVLHATDAGRPIYARMGYTPITTHTLFMEKRYLDAH